jgi:dipeptidyl aminopeptidase/acylaminoacyl peptidase
MIAPYGTWKSPLSARVIAAGALRISGITLDSGEIYWIEGRPSEGGRNVLVRRDANLHSSDLTPPGINVRTRLHEYGGPAYIVSGGDAYYVNFADQRVYRFAQFTHPDPSNAPQPITPAGYVYGDFTLDKTRGRLICAREDHTEEGREPVNTLVALPMDGTESTGQVLASGYDFYATPRVSPDGSQLAWLSWRHPQMPWDGTELWVANIDRDGTLASPRRIAGSATESIYQPGWGPDGTLYFVSDRTGWWTLYRSDAVPVLREPVERAEFGRPQWVFGTSTWAFAGPSRMVVSYTRDGAWHLATVDVESGDLTNIATDLRPHEWLAASDAYAFFVGGSSTSPDALVGLELATGATETIRISASLYLDPGYISIPDAIEFPTTGGRTAHAFYYPPHNKDFSAPPGEAPPLIVISHGGPTTAAKSTLELAVQYWTSRGFAVADVNYGGSSGYGRQYRERLNGQWGIVDVDDVVNAALFLSDSPGGPEGPPKADRHRLIIRGGSAGGYTTLAALTFRPGVFGAGASYYGVSDVEVLARDTHKFESRYLDSIIGPYPAMQDVYRARSPIHSVGQLACPLILFQGLEDKVVPPNQSQMMADAVRAKGLPVVCLTFEGEQHGFRRSETIIRCLEAELEFYGSVFGFAVL